MGLWSRTHCWSLGYSAGYWPPPSLLVTHHQPLGPATGPFFSPAEWWDGLSPVSLQQASQHNRLWMDVHNAALPIVSRLPHSYKMQLRRSTEISILKCISDGQSHSPMCSESWAKMLHEWEYKKCGESLKSSKNKGKDLLVWQEKKKPGESKRLDFQIKAWDGKIFFVVAFLTVRGKISSKRCQRGRNTAISADYQEKSDSHTLWIQKR